MKNYTEQEIARLQESLQLIRQSGGWTAEEFGEMIGVTKQTICNLEHKRTIKSKTQYIAIRAVLDWEISDRKDDPLLAFAVNMCLSNDSITSEDKKKAQAFISGAQRTGLDGTAIVAGIAALVGLTVVEMLGSPAVIGATGIWLARLLKDKK